MNCMTNSRINRGVLLSALLISLLTFTSGSEEIVGMQPGVMAEIQGVRLEQYGQPVVIMGHLTSDGNPIPGTNFYLFFDPAMEQGCGQTELWDEHVFPETAEANGALIAYILYPNGMVSFSISSSQFDPSYSYVLPFLPEDPPGMASIKFF
ncbi:hypothetical protein ACFLSG_03015 [Candidatus Bipolaricaulota bacterium]